MGANVLYFFERANFCQKIYALEAIAVITTQILTVYWDRQAKNSQAEVDYVAAHQQKVLPIKVKAGTQGGMKSLWLFMREKNLTEAVRCSLENFGTFEYKDQGPQGATRQVKVCPLYAVARM